MSKAMNEYDLQIQISQAMMQKWGYSRRQALHNRKKNISISGFDTLNPNSLPKIHKSNESEGLIFYGHHKTYMQAAQSIFDQFNAIVGYQKKKPKKQFFQLKPKQSIVQSTKIIRDRIEKTKNQLSKTNKSDLKSHFKINNKLNRLFKEFHKARSNEKPKTESMQQISMRTQDSTKFRKQHIHFIPSKIHLQLVKERKKSELIVDPFEKNLDQSFQKSKQVQTKIIHQNEILDIYKNKLQQVRSNILKQYSSIESNFEKSSQIISNQKQVQQNLDMYQMKTTQGENELQFQRIVMQNQKRQKAFTKILKNKNLKYIKSQGTNSLIKYNEKQQAKKLLSGRMIHSQRLNNNVNKLKLLNRTTEYSLQQMSGPPKKLSDDRDYFAELKIERLQASIKLRNKQSS